MNWCNFRCTIEREKKRSNVIDTAGNIFDVCYHIMLTPRKTMCSSHTFIIDNIWVVNKFLAEVESRKQYYIYVYISMSWIWFSHLFSECYFSTAIRYFQFSIHSVAVNDWTTTKTAQFSRSNWLVNIIATTAMAIVGFCCYCHQVNLISKCVLQNRCIVFISCDLMYINKETKTHTPSNTHLTEII